MLHNFSGAKCVEEEEWLIKWFFKLGQEVIEQQQYSKTAIKKLLEQTEQEEALQRRFSTEFLNDIIREFESETGNDLYIPVKNVLDRIDTCWSATNNLLPDMGTVRKE